MKEHVHTLAAGLLLCGVAAGGLVWTGERAMAWKDQGPASAMCDQYDKASPAWRACATTAGARMSDAELFYAGYWLARNGKYAEALGYLRQASGEDVRVLTYIGFATRKLGDVDAAMGFYNRALQLNPDYSVARAYMGEGFLAKGDLNAARGQLAEIAQRCGATCAEYGDLAQHIAAYEAGKG
jgi:Tfp pilus assembly protein PilF